MDEEQQLSDFLEKAGITSRRSFLRRTAIGAAALVGLSSGFLLRPGIAAAYVGCSCTDRDIDLSCDECPVCCAGADKCIIERLTWKDCHNRMVCGWQTIILCTCCCE
ncbi:MAG: twin-arginine translocation signal domain-containing protein [Gaiellaceae bacterium]